jgi:hypothetical protein
LQHSEGSFLSPGHRLNGRVNEMARNSLINLEEMSEGDVERMKTAFTALASTGTPVNRKAEASGPVSS